MGKEIRYRIRINDRDVLCFLAGRDSFYNLNQIYDASPRRNDDKFSPKAYAVDGAGQAMIGALASMAGVDKQRLIYEDKGGWWATHPLMIDYASWISPEFRLLVIEAASRFARREVERTEEWDQIRVEGKRSRRHFTTTIQEQGIPSRPGKSDGDRFSNLTNGVYLGEYDKTASQLKQDMGLGKNANLRDHLPTTELAMLSMAESMAAEKMKAAQIHDHPRAYSVCRRAGQLTRNAREQLENERI